MARLLYNDHTGRQQALELDPTRQQIVLGRQSDCDITVHDTSVSRRHCVIVPEGDGFAVVDLGSANGTLVNDLRITRRRLADNDIIRCGIYAVRFIDPRDEPPSTELTLADRYRRRSNDGGLRARAEGLQALAESQSVRLAQMQDELARVDAERTAALERAARSEEDLIAAGQQIREMQGHMRQLAAALEYRRADEVSEPPPPPGLPPATGSGPAIGALDQAALAADNRALQATIAQLEGALAAEDAFARSAALVPAVDRWRAVEGDRRALSEARRRVAEADAERAELRRSLGEARSQLQSSRNAPTPADIAALRAQVADLERQNQSLRDELDAAVEAPSPTASRLGPLGGGNTPGLLAGLGGLGQTSTDGELGRRSLSARLARLNRQAEEVDKLQGTIRDLRQDAGRRAETHARARADAAVLVERLERQRDTSGATGMAAVALAELVDLATTIRDTLD